MKKINKFSKLTVFFTALYFLIALFMRSDIYSKIYSVEWIRGIHLGYLPVIGLIVSIILGLISIIKVFKKGGLERWLMIALTLFNIAVLIFLY